jgi:serralysin
MAFTVWQVGPELKVNEITDGDQQAPSATALADGGWVVAWQSLAQDRTGWNIHQRRYDGAGVPDGAESIVNVAASDDQQSPGVTALADGGWIVTWQGDEPGGAPGTSTSAATTAPARRSRPTSSSARPLSRRR